MAEQDSQPRAYLGGNNAQPSNITNTGNKAYLDDSLYAPLSSSGGRSVQQFTGDEETDTWLNSLPAEQRQIELDAINAPLTGKEVAQKRLKNPAYVPSIEEFKVLRDYKKTQDTEFLSGLGEAGMHIAEQFGNAAEFIAKNPIESTYKAPANLIEATFQGFRNFYGMLGESENPDSVMFKFKDLITGDGTDESQYDQYLKALQFNNDTNDLMSGKQTIVMNKDYINNEIVQVTSNFTDPTLLVGLMTGGVGFTGKIAQAIGQAERLAAFGAKASAIKNGLYAGTLRWGAGVPLEMIGGATRNTIDYAVQKGSNAFEFASGISAAEGQNYVRRFGFGTAVTDLGGYGVPIASELSQAYVGAGIAKGFGEALNATIATAEKQGFKRGGISFARQALEESNAMLAKGGQGLSKHASNLLKVLDKADPFLIYARTGLEGATAGMVVGGGLGYLNDKEQGMYAGMGAGMVLGAIGATGGRALSDISGATRSMRYGVQAKMALEIMKDRSPVSNQTWSLLQNVFSKNVDDINKLIVAVDTALPNTEWATMSPDELKQTLKARGLDPDKYDGFEHEAVPAFEPKTKQTDFSQVSPEKYANFLATDFGYLPEKMKNAISGGDLSSFRDLLVKKGLTKFKDVPDNIVKLVADEYIKRENTHRTEVQGRKFELNEQQKKRYDYLASEESAGKEPKGTAEAYKKSQQERFEINKKDYYYGSQDFVKNERFKRQVDTNLDVLRSLDPAERANELKNLKENKYTIDDSKYYEETLRRAKEEGLVNSKGVGEAEASVVRYKKDANGNKIRSIDEMGYELPTVADLSGASGWHESKGVGGKSRVVINTDWLSKNTAPHEFGHGIFSELVFQPVFKERIRGYVLGNVDKDGKMITPPLIDLETAKKFFTRYIDIENTAEIAVERKQLLDKALKEYFIDGKMNVMDTTSKTPFLEKLVEEFGTYYWTQFIKGKPVDFLFRGGEMSMMDNVLEMVKNGYVDMMKTEIERANPNFRFNENATSLNDAFTDRKGNRVRVPELDALMTDMVKAVMQTNRKGSFDFSSLSVAGQEAYIKANGLERIVKKQLNGKYKVMSDKELDVANKARGVEIFKALDALDPKLKVVKDDKGNVIGGLTKVNNEYVGLLSNEVLDHLVATGHMSQGESSKIRLFQDISLGKTKANVVEMTYFGLSAQTTTGAVDIRVYGNKVPVKNRKVLVLGVDNTFRQNGVFGSKLSTMDWQVIETRGKNLWEDPVVRQLWGDDRGAFEGDFFRYLENASKPKTDPTRINDFAELWQESGAMKRNIMQQFAGLGKQADVAYANTPLTEIHWDINQSFMYLRADRASNIRVSNEKITYDHKNAGHDISRNMMPAEMMSEDTPNGKIHKHPSGYRFIENDKGVRVFDANGDDIGSFKNLDDALVKAKQDYTEKFPNEKPIDSLDNVKAEIVKPQFESRADYINKRVVKQLKSMGGKFYEKTITRLKERIESTNFEIELANNHTKRGNDFRDISAEYTKDKILFEKLLDAFEREDLSKLTQKELKDGLYRLQPDIYPKQHKTILDGYMDASNIIAKEWDAKYPMTFRSPLDDAVKSFFASGKDITAQQLLKKLLRVGSSKGIQIYSEADAIGLVKLLKSKIEKTKSIHRTINPETGNYYPRGTPDAPVIEKVAGEKLAILDKNEILKYLDENKIILTIEENAKEVRGLNTQDYTADGIRSGYRETALRINPMYMHDVIGHYNKAVAHLRTTDRVDAEGNSVNFGDEYQANNTDRANEKNLIYLKRRAERAKKFIGILDLTTLKNVALTDDAVNSSLAKFADSTITSFDVESVVSLLITSKSTSKERAFQNAIQNAALNAVPDGGTLTNFNEKKLKNYALTINNMIDAWASSSLQLLGKVSEGEYQSYLHTGRDDSINARNIIDRGVLSKENMTKFIKFVQNNYKLNLNKPAYDLFLELASHNTMFVQGMGEPLFMPENNQKVGHKVHREILSLAADRVTKTKEFTKENGFDDLQKIIQEGYFGGRYKLDYIMPEKIMTGITDFANLGEMKSGRKSNVLDRLGNGTNIEYLEDVHSYLSFGNIRFTENGDVFFRPIGDDYGTPSRTLSVGHGARESFVNSFKHFDSKEVFDSVSKRAMVQDSLKERLQKAEESSEAIDRESWKFEDLSKDKIMEWSIDFQSQIERYKASLTESEPYPFMSVEEWGVHLIKMQIREAIQKGQKKITITHPDDSPTKSNAPESRYRMYGVILPNLARGIVGKYGIEVKQDLKLHTKNVSDALEAHGKDASVTHVLMQNALDIFQRNASGESADIINKITIELAMPVKDLIAREKDRLIKDTGKTDESTIESATRLSRDGDQDWNFTTTELIQKGVKNAELRIALQNVVGGKTNEWKSYSKYLIESERSIKGKQMPSNADLWTMPDADKAKLQTELAIDRGNSFILNDEIIQAFIRNDEGTAMKQYMPRDDKEKVVPRIVNKEEHMRMMAIVKAVPHLNDAYENGELTFDEFQHSKYRKYHVVSHGLDNASTVDWKDPDTGEVIFKAQGGGTYPAYRSPQGWATNLPSMADQINRVGALNYAEHKEWIVPVMFIKGKDSKVGGSANGSIGFVNAFYALNKRGAINDKVFKSGLLSAFKTYFKEKGFNLNKDSSIGDIVDGARKILSDKKYPPFNEKASILNTLNSAVYESVDYSNPFVEKLIPSVADFKSNKRILVDDLKNAIFGMMSDPLFEHAKHIQGKGQGGEVYGMVMFNSEVEAKAGDYHDSYTHSIIKKDGTPAKVDILTTPIHPRDLIKNYVTEVKTNKDKSLKLDDNGKPIYKEGIIGDENWADKEAGTGQKNLAAVHNKLHMPKDIGDRSYSNSQLEDNFIGKYAEQNPSLVKGLNIEYYSNDTSSHQDLDATKWHLVVKDKNDREIGRIIFEYEDKGNFFNGTEDVSGLVVRDISVLVGNPENRGKGYQHLLYSEMFERARANGAIGFTQNIENKLGLPLKSINRIVGDKSSKIWTLRDYEPVETTQENFNNLMAKAPKVKSYKGTSAEYVQNNGQIDSLKFYMPNEFKDGLKRLIDAVDAQSTRDQVPANVKAGVSTLVQAIKRQGDEDVRAGIIRGVQQLADAIDRQSDEDKVPERVKAGIKNLIKASQEVGKPVKPKAQPRTPAKITPKNVQAENEPTPETQPVFNNNFPQPQFTSKWRSFVQENTTDGNSIFKNAMNYVIIQAGKKYRVYNPYKTMIGIYDDLEQAKRRVQREEPKQR